MSSLVTKIANYLYRNWPKIAKWIKDLIRQITGGLIIDSVVNNWNSLVHALSQLSDSVLNYIARLLGL